MELVKLDTLEKEVTQAPQHFLQSALWTKFKEQHGWVGLSFAFRSQPNESWQELRVLCRKLHGYTLTYCPFPSHSESLNTDSKQRKDWEELLKLLKLELPSSTFLLRIDSSYQTLTDSESNKKKYLQYPLKGARVLSNLSVQPQSSVILSLKETEEKMLENMHKKWRYNIRLSAKKGIRVQEINYKDLDSGLDCWYDLYKETAQRDGIALHHKNYYSSLFNIAQNSSQTDSSFQVHLYLAYYTPPEQQTEKALAGIIVLHHNDQAVYLFGASSNSYRETMPAYALQWHAITAMKKTGALYYDFYGIPESGENPSDPMHGLYRFKTGFGGQILHSAGIIDIPIKRGVYAAYQQLEALRFFYFKRLKKWLRRH